MRKLLRGFRKRDFAGISCVSGAIVTNGSKRAGLRQTGENKCLHCEPAMTVITVKDKSSPGNTAHRLEYYVSRSKTAHESAYR